jgi:hypothetical protein
MGAMPATGLVAFVGVSAAVAADVRRLKLNERKQLAGRRQLPERI